MDSRKDLHSLSQSLLEPHLLTQGAGLFDTRTVLPCTTRRPDAPFVTPRAGRPDARLSDVRSWDNDAASESERTGLGDLKGSSERQGPYSAGPCL